jgi:hypothetical protein
VSQVVCTAAATTDAGDDPVIEVFEPGLAGRPWPVTCDESGSATPVEQGGTFS